MRRTVKMIVVHKAPEHFHIFYKEKGHVCHAGLQEGGTQLSECIPTLFVLRHLALVSLKVGV